MSPRPVTATRERILEVSRRLFHEQGYHATGIATILREARVNSGSLYHFFPEQGSAPRVAVLEWYVENLHAEVMGPVEATTDGPDRTHLRAARPVPHVVGD